jgi:hypothetical protein
VDDLWNPNPERGLYKTTDGGKTWKAVLTAPALCGDKVGCGEMSILTKGLARVHFLVVTVARKATPRRFRPLRKTSIKLHARIQARA